MRCHTDVAEGLRQVLHEKKVKKIEVEKIVYGTNLNNG